nr:unnamed protein product [Callosobruchus chinensis]
MLARLEVLGSILGYNINGSNLSSIAMSLSVSCTLLLVYFVALGITVESTLLEEILKNPQKSATHLSGSSPHTLRPEEDPLDSVLSDDMREIRRGKKDSKVWDYWGKWSPCSVSCGVGKMTRWRHCLSQSCEPGEKEAQIKTCNINPCS